MKITAQLLPISKITQTTLPGLNGAPAKVGFSIGGFYLNGSHEFTTPEALQAHLIGKELTPSASGKSLVIKGAFVPIEKDTDLMKSILTAREAYVPLESVNLADLL